MKYSAGFTSCLYFSPLLSGNRIGKSAFLLLLYNVTVIEASTRSLLTHTQPEVNSKII